VQFTQAVINSVKAETIWWLIVIIVASAFELLVNLKADFNVKVAADPILGTKLAG
jgi:hypothetical protein